MPFSGAGSLPAVTGAEAAGSPLPASPAAQMSPAHVLRSLPQPREVTSAARFPWGRHPWGGCSCARGAGSPVAVPPLPSLAPTGENEPELLRRHAPWSPACANSGLPAGWEPCWELRAAGCCCGELLFSGGCGGIETLGWLSKLVGGGGRVLSVALAGISLPHSRHTCWAAGERPATSRGESGTNRPCELAPVSFASRALLISTRECFLLLLSRSSPPSRWWEARATAGGLVAGGGQPPRCFSPSLLGLELHPQQQADDLGSGGTGHVLRSVLLPQLCRIHALSGERRWQLVSPGVRSRGFPARLQALLSQSSLLSVRQPALHPCTPPPLRKAGTSPAPTLAGGCTVVAGGSVGV